MRTLLFIPIMLILNFCSTKSEFKFIDMNIDQFQYSFHDSALSQNQRNYTITVKTDSVQIIVRGYSDIISDTSFASSPEKLNAIIKLLDDGKVKNCAIEKNDGYMGGTGESILCTNKGETVFSGNVYHCADMDSGNLSGDYSLAVKASRALIPGFDELIKK